MEIDKLKELNEKILEKAASKIEKAHTLDNYDYECMKAMSMAIDNMKDLIMIKEYKTYKKENYEPEAKNYHRKRIKGIEGDSEFVECIYEILDKQGESEGIEGIIEVFDESMDEIKILHKRMYDRIMSRLKEMK